MNEDIEDIIGKIKKEWAAELQKNGISLPEKDINIAVMLLAKSGINAAQEFIRQRLGSESE